MPPRAMCLVSFGVDGVVGGNDLSSEPSITLDGEM